MIFMAEKLGNKVVLNTILYS